MPCISCSAQGTQDYGRPSTQQRLRKTGMAPNKSFASPPNINTENGMTKPIAKKAAKPNSNKHVILSDKPNKNNYNKKAKQPESFIIHEKLRKRCSALMG
jgi:hypothetical protein